MNGWQESRTCGRELVTGQHALEKQRAHFMAGKLRLENLQVQRGAEPVATPEAGDMKSRQ